MTAPKSTGSETAQGANSSQEGEEPFEPLLPGSSLNADVQPAKMLMNGLLFAVSVAAVPNLSKAVVPWWWEEPVEGIVTSIALIWVIILFFLKDDIVAWGRKLLTSSAITRGCAIFLVLQLGLFSLAWWLLPRPDEPIVRILPYGALLRAELNRGGALIVYLDGTPQPAITDPTAAAVYIGRLKSRVVWRLRERQAEEAKLETMAKGVLEHFGNDLTRENIERTTAYWLQGDPPIRSAEVYSGARVTLSLRLSSGEEQPLTCFDLERFESECLVLDKSEATILVTKEI